MLPFFKDFAERRVFRYLIGYFAAGWAILGIVDQLADNSILPPFSYQAAFAFLACGLPGAIIVSWFHGKRGRQQVSRLEAVLLGVVAVFALTTTGFVVRSRMAGPGGAKGLALAPEEDPSRLAVLYFEARGGGDAEFLAAGLTEALINELSGVNGLHVVSRNGSQLFRSVAVPADSVSRALRVGTIVTGTVALAGDRVRLEVGLTNGATQKQFAFTRLERGRAEIFALQDQLAYTVSVFLRKAIGVELGGLKLRKATESVQAWELVQQAGHSAANADLLVRNNDLPAASRTLVEADSLLALAETVDKSWIEPVIRRGWLAYRQSRLGGMDRDLYVKWIGHGLQHANRALQRDSLSAAARELQATLIYWKYLLNLAGSPEETSRTRDEAEAGFRAAIAADSSRAFALTSLSHLLINRGEFAEAKVKALLAYHADPFLDNADVTLWRIFLAAWNLQDGVEARRYCQESAHRFPSFFRVPQCQLMSYALPGEPPDITKALKLVTEFADLSPPQARELNLKRGYAYLALALARAGQADSARAILQKSRAAPDIDPLREVAQIESIAHTWIGDKEVAVRDLADYFAANPGTLDAYRDQARTGQLPWFHQQLLEEPRFRSLVGLR
jgi:TolB-like protein